jgi:hypothetical protein
MGRVVTDALRRRARPEPRPTFVLRLQAKPGTDGVRNLRLLLKSALRRFHLRCLDAHQIEERREAPDGERGL